MEIKKILKVAGLFLLAGVLTVLMGFVHKKQAKVMCKSMDIRISGERSFVAKSDIEAIVEAADSTILWQPINYARLRTLEKAIRKSPYVENVSVYASVNGVLKVEIDQRDPVARIINGKGVHFYIDRQGYKIPLSANYTPKVLVASGNIPENFSGKPDTLATQLARDIRYLAGFLERDRFWKAQIGQVFVNGEGEMELIPRVGDHRILLGSVSNLQKKLDKLLIFYREAMPRVGWDTYKVINVKYDGQIVGVKNNIH